MFKPNKSNYVLSVRLSHRANLESLYTDPEPQKTDTGWRYKYQQVITIGGPKWKNNGMQSNIEDVVPVGVFRNTGGKSRGKTMYEVLGVAYVRSYDETTGYFELEYSPSIITDINVIGENELRRRLKGVERHPTGDTRRPSKIQKRTDRSLRR